MSELHGCRAMLRSAADGVLRCQGEVSDWTTHVEDHWAFVGSSGNKVHWTDAVAFYPPRTDPTERYAAANPEAGGPARESQVGGEHYKKFKIQPWDIWQEYGLDAFTGAILKYLLRDKGNRLEDLKKARHTLDRLIEIEEQREA